MTGGCTKEWGCFVGLTEESGVCGKPLAQGSQDRCLDCLECHECSSEPVNGQTTHMSEGCPKCDRGGFAPLGQTTNNETKGSNR